MTCKLRLVSPGCTHGALSVHQVDPVILERSQAGDMPCKRRGLQLGARQRPQGCSKDR